MSSYFPYLYSISSEVFSISNSFFQQMAVMAWAHGGIVIYSTDSMESFKIAEECIAEIKRVTMRDALIVLVGKPK